MYLKTLGFATVGTNNGHNGTSARAFFNNPNVIEGKIYDYHKPAITN